LNFNLNYFTKTPPGIFCPNRFNQQRIPLMPTAFDLHTQLIQPLDNQSFVGILGPKLSKQAYDFDYDIIRLTSTDGYKGTDQINDFRTGLVYKFDVPTSKCEVSKLTDTIKDENIYFDFNSVDYQYTGKVTKLYSLFI